MLVPYFRFPEYSISDDGTLYRPDGKPIPKHKDQHGYMASAIYVNGKNYCIILHVAVARAFVPGYQPGLQVNHIDGDKTNNNASNLEWVTRSQNMRHAVDVLGSNKGKRNGFAKPIILLVPETSEIAYEFDAIADALRMFYPERTQLQIQRLGVSARRHLLSGKPWHGYIWKYKNS